ncbi:DUF2953 domain-containing protein [Bacillus kexueae]|uniref:DUF2953 domain-containing protein n=1 Tax=Aeribacillus kexueae TaxID=2078952 RepID=UPI001FAECA3F|nr:DUF2953 domain-containing protein [Bacillus kexueae]
MNGFLWSLVIVVGIIILLFTSKLKITFDFLHDGDNDHIKIKFRTLIGLVRYTIDIPLIKVDKENQSIVLKEKKGAGSEGKQQSKDRTKISPQDILDSLHDVNELARHVIGLHAIVRQFMRKVQIKRFEWHTHFGVGDAAHTGMLIGVAWSLKGLVLQCLTRYMKLTDSPRITVTPDFYRMVSNTSLQCMISFRLGHAILAGLRFIKHWVGGKPTLRKRSIPLLTKNEDNDQSA